MNPSDELAVLSMRIVRALKKQVQVAQFIQRDDCADYITEDIEKFEEWSEQAIRNLTILEGHVE